MGENQFHGYCTVVFDPNVRDLQENPGLADELDVLFMDSVGHRASRQHLMLLGQNRIIAIISSGHTVNRFQGLDLSYSV
jgi:hypothetical protein